MIRLISVACDNTCVNFSRYSSRVDLAETPGDCSTLISSLLLLFVSLCLISFFYSVNMLYSDSPCFSTAFLLFKTTHQCGIEQLIQGVLTDTITLRNMEITRCILCTKNYYHGGNGIHPNGGFTRKKNEKKREMIKNG